MVNKKNTSLAILQWYQDVGLDDCCGEQPINLLHEPFLNASLPEKVRNAVLKKTAATTKSFSTLPLDSLAGPHAISAQAKEMVAQCHSREELKEALLQFNGCALKKTATNTVFSDGNPQAKIMIMGEAPGANEDIQGIPYCGDSGKLLDTMLATIQLSRKENVYISNAIFWRPPGNRKPTPEEIAICKPFVERHISLIAPRLLILTGSTPVTAILNHPGSISLLRGKIHQYHNPYLAAPVPTIVMYHPSYLLRQPSQKKLAWADLLFIKQFFDHSLISPKQEECV